MLAVFDIDGVVADVRHRLHYLDQPKSWAAFFEAAGEDTLIPAGARLVADLAQKHQIVWLTGRPEWLRDTTADWLDQHGLPGTELHLRPNRDHRPARLYKVDVLRRLTARTIAAFVDDDPEVIAAAIGAGFPAVLANWLPRDDILGEAQERFGRT